MFYRDGWFFGGEKEDKGNKVFSRCGELSCGIVRWGCIWNRGYEEGSGYDIGREERLGGLSGIL